MAWAAMSASRVPRAASQRTRSYELPAHGTKRTLQRGGIHWDRKGLRFNTGMGSGVATGTHISGLPPQQVSVR